MLRRKGKNEEERTLDTMLGPGTFFEGTMKAEKSVRIEGAFKGELFCSGFLMITESSRVEAQIEGMDVYINGIVRGTVGAKRVRLDREARLIGDIYTQKLSIVEGAIFHGRSQPLEEGEADDQSRDTPERRLLSS